jgi:hypothetical protein
MARDILKFNRSTIPLIFTEDYWRGKERQPIPPKRREEVWEKWFGTKNQGICVCCKERPIFSDDFVCGHKRADASLGSIKLSNLKPICHRCNNKMRGHDLDPWCKKYRQQIANEKKRSTKSATSSSPKKVTTATTTRKKPKTMKTNKKSTTATKPTSAKRNNKKKTA